MSLARRLPGRRVERVGVHFPTLREPLDEKRLRRLVAGRRILELRRRAKYLLIDLIDETRPEASTRAATLVVHLGMSGRLTVVPEEEPEAEHEHVTFHLDHGERLRLVDPRRFGVVFALLPGELTLDPHFVHLGIEPLSPDFNGAHLQRVAEGRRGPIKNLLMDARLVVGVGNIYACETLWRAGVHPRRSAARISEATWERLADTVQEVLGDAIEKGGTTLNDFQDGEGNSGYFQISLAVYGREGEPCPRCGREIRRQTQAGRGTFYCPGCQH